MFGAACEATLSGQIFNFAPHTQQIDVNAGLGQTVVPSGATCSTEAAFRWNRRLQP